MIEHFDLIYAMKIFSKVAQLSSFTRAAERLGLPKASVSESIQALEAHLGVRLLHRTTRQVQVTQDGLVFLERCRDLLAEVETTEALFQKHAPRLSGRLRVDMPHGFARRILIPRLPEFLAAHPGIEIELSSTDRRVDVVQEGFDCVIRVGNLQESGLIARSLGSLRIINCASPAYVKNRGMPRDLSDLAHHQLIHYAPVFGLKTLGFEYLADGEYRELRMKGAVTVNNSEAYVMACLHGLGIIQAPLVGMDHYLNEGSLLEILPQYVAEPMPMHLIYPHRRNLSPRVRVFMDWVASLMPA